MAHKSKNNSFGPLIDLGNQTEEDERKKMTKTETPKFAIYPPLPPHTVTMDFENDFYRTDLLYFSQISKTKKKPMSKLVLVWFQTLNSRI